MREKGKEILKKYHVFFIFFLLNLIFYSIFSIWHYAADSYLTEILGWMEVESIYYAGGRWLMSAFCRLLDLFQISYAMGIRLSWMLAIFSLSGAALVVYRCLQARQERSGANLLFKKVWSVILAFMLISNVFVLEDFIFAEYTGIMCLGIFFDVLGAGCILRFLEQRKPVWYILGIVCGILGINGHQGSFAVLVVVCALFATDTFDSWKMFIRNNIAIGSAYVLPALANLAQTRIVGNARVSGGGTDILASVRKVTEGVYHLGISTANFLPQKFYAGWIFILIVYFLYCVILRKNKKAMLFGVYVLLIMAMGIYAPFLVTTYEAIDIVPRTVYIMGGVIPVLLITMEIHVGWEKAGRMFLPAMAGVFLLVQYLGILRIGVGNVRAVEADFYETQFVVDRLLDYEKETGIKVRKMALYWDADVTGHAEGVVGFGAINERMLSNEWAAPFAIQCHQGFEIWQTDKSEEVYKKYFEGKDWSGMDEEQMVMIGDTLHLCSY